MREPTVIAIDWSGAKRAGDVPGIWVAAQCGSTVVVDKGSWSRDGAVAFVLAQPVPVVVGFDFSFGVPAWFARERGCATIDEVWDRAARDGEQWLRPSAPFWRDTCRVPPERRFRRCEERLRAQGYAPKSVFQLVGNGQVGAGSVRGMPHLTRLRAAGFSVWPFDAPSDRTVVEIYPSLLRRRFPHLDDERAPTTDARDARASVRAMAARADEFGELGAAIDPVTRLEGDVWVPAV